MVITLDAELEAALDERARLQGVSPEALALETLRAQFLRPLPAEMLGNKWVLRLRRLATDCGVSLSDGAVSSEGIYD
jgi:hypothetical protein